MELFPSTKKNLVARSAFWRKLRRRQRFFPFISGSAQFRQIARATIFQTTKKKTGRLRFSSPLCFSSFSWLVFFLSSYASKWDGFLLKMIVKWVREREERERRERREREDFCVDNWSANKTWQRRPVMCEKIGRKERKKERERERKRERDFRRVLFSKWVVRGAGDRKLSVCEC